MFMQMSLTTLPIFKMLLKMLCSFRGPVLYFQSIVLLLLFLSLYGIVIVCTLCVHISLLCIPCYCTCTVCCCYCIVWHQRLVWYTYCYCTLYMAKLLHCMASEVGEVHPLLLLCIHFLCLSVALCSIRGWCGTLNTIVWYTYCYCTLYTWQSYCIVWHQRLVWYTPYIRPLCDCYCAPHSLTMPQSPSLLSSRLLLFLYHIYVRYKYQNMDMKYLRSPQFPSISRLL